MNLKKFLHAKRAMKRWINSYRQRTFIGFKGRIIKPYGFRSYYFAHVYTARDYRLGVKHGVKQPHGACLSVLIYMKEMAEALGFGSVEEFENHQKWLLRYKQHRAECKAAIAGTKDGDVIDLRNITAWEKVQ